MLKKAGLSLFLISSFILLSTSPVFANTWEYVTHGGYDAAVEAWKRVALIFSHSGYAGLFTVGVVVGLFAILAGMVMKAAFGLRINVYSFLPYYLTATVVFLAFILPKDKLVIYDETLNRGPYEVDGVPRLVATIAGVINKTENAMIEVLATSGDPVQDYRYNPAGISFHALGSINTKQIPGYVYTSLYNYYEDCIVTSAEIGTYLTWEDIISGKYSFVETINVANNPSLFTTIYDANGQATTLSCQEAAPIVAGYLTSEANFNSALRGGCARVGYDPDSTASFQQCKNMLANSFAFLAQSAGISISANYLFPLQQMLFAEIANHYALMNGPEALGSFLATQRTSSTYLGLGIHANSWIPELKETLTAITISLTPVLLIFLVTPLALKAFSLTAGMFLWLAIWGVIDALVFSFGLSMASSSAKYLANASVTNGFGIFAATILPNVTAKIYAIFGALRWAGLMLASAISMMLVRFGGYALSMLAGQLTSIPAGAGAEMGRNLLYNPSESVMKSLAEAGAWGNAAAAEGIVNLTRGLMNMQAATLRARGEVGNAYFPQKLLQSELSKLNMEIAKYSNLNTEEAVKAGTMQAYKTSGEAQGYQDLINTIKGSQILKQMLGLSGNPTDKQIMTAVQKAGIYSGAVDTMGKYGITKEDLESPTMLAFTNFAKQVRAFENYLQKGFTEDMQKDPLRAVNNLTNKLANVEQAKLQLEAGKGELNPDVISKVEAFNWFNPAAKAMAKMMLMDKLDDGKISEETMQAWQRFTQVAKDLNLDAELLRGHFSNIDLTVQSEEMARSLQEHLGINANVGDTIRMSFALTNQNGEYDLVVPTHEVIATKPQEVDILGNKFNLIGGEITTRGTEGNAVMMIKGGTLGFSGGRISLKKARVDTIQGQEVLKEFEGGYAGNAAGLKMLLHDLGLFGMVRSNTDAWRKISSLADEGRMIKIDYEDGALKISSEGKVLYERTGATVSKESVDELSTYKYGFTRETHKDDIISADQGIKDAKSALYLIESGDIGLYSQIVHQMLTNEGAKYTNLKMLTEGFNQLFERKGSDISYNSAEGHVEGGLGINLGFIRASAGGSLAAGYRSMDERTVDLNQVFTHAAWRQAYEETVQEFGGKDFSQLTGEERAKFEQTLTRHFSQRIGEIRDFYNDYLANTNKFHYGATAFGERIYSAAVKSISWLKDKAGEVAEEVAKTKKEIDKSWEIA